MNKLQKMEQIGRALQLLALDMPETDALEVAAIFPAWEAKKEYTAGQYLTHGVNSVGDPQLYKVVQDHTSLADWTPDTAPALYTAIGLDGAGYPVWSRPTGAHDAYSAGDVVDYNGTLYRSAVDGNVWSPAEYPDGWEDYAE